MTTPNPEYHVVRAAECLCSRLCFATEQDLAALSDKRHHPACPLHKTEKHPRLFYYEEAENCWCPAPDKIENVVSLDCFFEDQDRMEIEFKRIDMTDDEFYNLEEA